jgi:hypothetical protein
LVAYEFLGKFALGGRPERFSDVAVHICPAGGVDGPQYTALACKDPQHAALTRARTARQFVLPGLAGWFTSITDWRRESG